MFKNWILFREDALPLLVAALALSILLLWRILSRLTRATSEETESEQTNYEESSNTEEKTVLPSPRLNIPLLTEPSGVSSGASSIGGKQKQEDAWLSAEIYGNKVLAIADGISSSNQAHLAAKAAVNTTVEAIKKIWEEGREVETKDLKEVFTYAQAAVAKEAQGLPENGLAPATTLIVALEQAESFLLGYLGDGAAVLTTGNLKWMQNLLFPQTGQAGAITSYLSADCDHIMPAVMELPKTWPDGGVLLLGSDGALPQGEVISTSAQILDQIQSILSGTIPENAAEATCSVLADWVQARLKTDDNRTLGVLVSREAFCHWKKTKLAAQS
ncbi:MAG: protein phosphatase 2C domain-containing protein [Anaerolineales bacterium]